MKNKLNDILSFNYLIIHLIWSIPIPIDPRMIKCLNVLITHICHRYIVMCYYSNFCDFPHQINVSQGAGTIVPRSGLDLLSIINAALRPRTRAHPLPATENVMLGLTLSLLGAARVLAAARRRRCVRTASLCCCCCCWAHFRRPESDRRSSASLFFRPSPLSSSQPAVPRGALRRVGESRARREKSERSILPQQRNHRSATCKAPSAQRIRTTP